MSTQVENAKPATENACSVCGAPMPPGSSRCEQCGATHGQEHRCPFCRVVAEPQPHPRLRFACPACGAPRVLVRDKGFQPSDDMTRHLGKARSAASSMVTWKVASAAAAGFGVLAALLLTGVAMIASPPAFAILMGALVTSMPFIFAALGWRNAGVRHAELQAELDSTWLEAARTLAQSHGTVTAGQLGKTFGLDEAAARQLASRLGASNEVTTDVTDSGDLALSIRVPDKLRIDAGVEAKPVQADSGEVVEQAAGSDTGSRGKGGA